MRATKRGYKRTQSALRASQAQVCQCKPYNMTLAKMDGFLKYANFFFKAIGLRPYKKASEPQTESIWVHLLFLVNVFNLSYVFILEAVYVLIALATGEHILEAITTMSYIGFVLVCGNKMLFVWWKRPQLSLVMQQLEEVFPRGKDDQIAYRLDQYLTSCSRISFTFAMLYSVLIWTFNLFNVMQYLFYEVVFGTRHVDLTLPYIMYWPWNWEDNWSFYLLLFSQNFAGYTSAAGQVSTDLMLCAVATLIIMHYDYIARTIETKQLSGDWAQDSRFIADIVRYHEHLLSLSDHLNDVFGVPLLMNFLISSFVICFVGFQMTVGVEPDVMIKLFLFLFSSLCQVYLICHHGQLMADAVGAPYSLDIVLRSFVLTAFFADSWHRDGCLQSGLEQYGCALS